MTESWVFWVAPLIGLTAALYSAVGHGGASAYLAIMTLLSLSPELKKPSALLLNLLVAGIGAVQFARAGHFRWRLLWPFAIASIPMAYLGARLKVSPAVYGLVLGISLFWAAARLILPDQRSTQVRRPLPAPHWTLAIGAVLGLVSGICGVGGGIFLSPLFLLAGWATPQETAAVSAAFIWLNSASGLLGQWQTGARWPSFLPPWVLAAAVGGVAGSFLGGRRWTGLTLRRVLAAVLATAAVKSFFGG